MKHDRMPLHLKDLAVDLQDKERSLRFKLKCPCGNRHFTVLEMGIAPEKKSSWPTLSSSLSVDDDGKQYCIKRTFFGIPIQKVPLEQLSRQIVKVQCPDCGQEFVLFDSSKHGYDAICDEVDGTLSDSGEETFRTRCDHCEILIDVQHDLSYDEFEEAFDGEVAPEQYANAFSSLAIYSCQENKKKNLYGFETM